MISSSKTIWTEVSQEAVTIPLWLLYTITSCVPLQQSKSYLWRMTFTLSGPQQLYNWLMRGISAFLVKEDVFVQPHADNGVIQSHGVKVTRCQLKVFEPRDINALHTRLCTDPKLQAKFVWAQTHRQTKRQPYTIYPWKFDLVAQKFEKERNTQASWL